MWSEGFTIIGSPLEHATKLWPNDFQNFCDTIEVYQKQMKKLAGKLMWLMLGSLGITNKEDVKWCDEGGCGALQLNSYPACPEPDRAMGLAPHTVSTILTILHQSNISGLQVLREGCGWVTVAPLAGALVVHVGDLLHILSNGMSNICVQTIG
uniref:2-oxoglutarate-dependent dioxygenase GA 3-oxidase n=1 Tax=Jasminum sambac TaxID=660624 RepID=A0A977R5B0_9LAMI|nr:2-oxoglutarate-dependent dioxygenase GA 3-oxidase [Jasminum sambac]